MTTKSPAPSAIPGEPAYLEGEVAQLSLPSDTDAGTIDRMKLKREAMREHLAAQPKRRIKLPDRSSSGDTTAVPVILNGLRFSIRRGMAIDVPEQIADLLAEADVW